MSEGNPPVVIRHDGDVWNVVAFGATRRRNGDGETLCTLESVTRVQWQRPIRMAQWVPWRVLQSALIQREEAQRARYSDVVTSSARDPRDQAITDYYRDRATGAHAARAR